MTKDALASVEMFQRLFASKEEKEHPFLGSGMIQEVVGAAEDLAGRVTHGPSVPVVFKSAGLQKPSAPAAVAVESDSDSDDDDDVARAPNAKLEHSLDAEKKQNCPPPCCRDIDGPCYHEHSERKQACEFEWPEPGSWWCHECRMRHTHSSQCPYMVDQTERKQSAVPPSKYWWCEFCEMAHQYYWQCPLNFDRMDERKQAGSSVEANPGSPFACECVGSVEVHVLDGVAYCGACLKEKKIVVPVAYPVSDGKAHAAAVLREDAAQVAKPEDAMHAGLRKIWDTQEALVQLNKLRSLAEKKTWIVPLACLLLFGGLLVIGRCMRSNPVPAKSGKEKKRELKEAKRAEKKEALKKAFTEHLEAELKKVKSEKLEAWVLPKWMQYEEIPGMGGCCHDPKNCPLKEGRPAINSMQKCDVECGGATCVHWAGCNAHSVLPKNLAPVEKPEAAKPKVDATPTEEKEDRKKKSKGVNPRPSGKGTNKNFTKRIRKPWVDYDDEGGVISVTYEDEMGNLVTRAGRRAAKSALGAYYAKYGAGGTFSETHEAKFAELQKRPFLLANEEELAEDAIVLRMPKGVVFEKLEGKFEQPACSGKIDCKCGRVYHSVKKANAKGLKAAKKNAAAKHDAWKKNQKCYKCHALGHVASDCENVMCACGKKDHTQDKPVKKIVVAPPEEFRAPAAKAAEKQESMVNGERFRTAGVVKSLGWAETNDGRGSCFCACWNGLYIPEHLVLKDATHPVPAETVTLFHAEYPSGISVKVADAKKIGRDSMILARPAGWDHKLVPNLGWTNPKVAAKVKLIAFASRAEALAGQCHDDAGVVKSIVSMPDQERAVYSCSSVDGNCGAPVVSTDGKLVGWHNSTIGNVATTFIPATSLMCQKATGSASSF
jgi:hypothetical protein